MFSREAITDALRFWETARIPYNLVLLALTIAAALVQADECPDCNVLQHIQYGEVFIWAVLANVVYCFAYVPDFFVQHSDFRSARVIWRIVIWITGTLFAANIAWSVASGLLFYPY
jgi:hypothetical protein